MKNDKDAHLGVKEIAVELGCSTKTVRRYHANGVIPSYQPQGKFSAIKMTRVDLRNFIKKKKKERRG